MISEEFLIKLKSNTTERVERATAKQHRRWRSHRPRKYITATFDPMKHSVAADTPAEHADRCDDATMDGNVDDVHSPTRESNNESPSNSNDMKYEQTSSEYQPNQADRIQPIPIIDSSTRSNNRISSDPEPETKQSNATEMGASASPLPSSSHSHQSECETNHNDTLDANEIVPSSSMAGDTTTLPAAPNNIDTENECNSDGSDTNDPIKISQSRHVRNELDLFCYVCSYGFKSFPRLIRHMETKKHANQVEKYHAINTRHCSNAHAHPVANVAGPGCDQRRQHVYQQRPPMPPYLMAMPMRPPQQQLLHHQPHHRYHHHPYHHQPYHYQQATAPTMTSTTARTATMGHGEMELLPEDVINEMINSLGEDIHSNGDAFSEFDTTDLSEMLEYLQWIKWCDACDVQIKWMDVLDPFFSSSRGLSPIRRDRMTLFSTHHRRKAKAIDVTMSIGKWSFDFVLIMGSERVIASITIYHNWLF